MSAASVLWLRRVVWVCGREYDLLFPFCSTLFTARTPVLSQDTPEERLPKGCVAVRCGVRQRPAYHGLGHGEWSTAWGAIGHTQKHKHKHSASIRIDQSSKEELAEAVVAAAATSISNPRVASTQNTSSVGATSPQSRRSFARFPLVAAMRRTAVQTDRRPQTADCRRNQRPINAGTVANKW